MKRTLVIQDACSIHTQAERLVVSNHQADRSVPLSDIASVMIEHPQIRLSSPLLAKCAEHNIAVIACDDKRIPCGVFLPFNTHSVVSRRIQEQIQLPRSVKDALWSKIVLAKITNQSKVLAAHGKADAASRLLDCGMMILPGDRTNIEGIAAREYFTALFGADFSRENGSVINAGLNYGYAVVRATVARTIVAAGLQPALGLHHCNQFNQFNLADDVIEPFRPVVDRVVLTNCLEVVEFNSVVKRELLSVLAEKVRVQGRQYVLPDAIEVMVADLVRCIESKSSKFTKLPS